MKRKIRDLLRPVKHRLWPRLARVKRLLVDSGLRGRHIVSTLRAGDAAGRLSAPASSPHGRSVFPQGTVTSHSRRVVRAWNRTHYRHSVLVIAHADRISGDVPSWIAAVRGMLGAVIVTVAPGDHPDIPGTQRWDVPARLIRREVLRRFARHDLILVDGRQPLPDVDALVALKFAAHRYPGHEQIGVVVPARHDADGRRLAGWDFDRTAGGWRLNAEDGVRDYGQSHVPRYVLTDQMHGMYVKASFVRDVAPPDTDDYDELAAGWIAKGWAGSRRTLLYAPATLVTPHIAEPPSSLTTPWLRDRQVRDADGRVRVIFVLPATSLSGGIRATLELAEGLAGLGMAVEVWSLQGQPDWTDVGVRVQEFRDYASLLDALEPEDALKVATWWETGQVVWLASVNHGIPLQYVQEFETWFYPTLQAGRAAVVSSYRREFVYTTIAAYQQTELEEIGVRAELIPSAFDDRIFHERPEIVRDDDSLLALGRSFFQKNFAMTLNAWRSLGDERPRLRLFGIEPDLVADPRAEYAFRPSDEEIALMYNSATAFIQTSRHEGFSLPIIEAMASGCPVITTDSHGNGFCVDEVNCLMIGQDDIEGAAAAIRRVLGDPELRERLRAAGLETATRHTWTRISRQTADFYTAVADGVAVAT